MYKIIGGDGKEYGPITSEQLRQWYSQGRINGETQVKAEGDPEWQPLKTLPALADLFAKPPPIMAPATSQAKTSGWAITSLVLGILGFFSCGITAVFGLVTGIVGLKKIKKSEGRLTGSGLAIAGIAVSGIMILMLPLMAAMALPAFAKAKAKAQQISCMNSARQLTLGVMLFADDNTNRCPTAATWCDDIFPVIGQAQVYQCKAGSAEGRSHFAFNDRLSGLELDSIKSPATTVMIFEIAGGWNQSGGRELALQPPRHQNGIVVGFADGHVELVTEAQLTRLNWEP